MLSTIRRRPNGSLWYLRKDAQLCFDTSQVLRYKSIDRECELGTIVFGFDPGDIVTIVFLFRSFEAWVITSPFYPRFPQTVASCMS